MALIPFVRGSPRRARIALLLGFVVVSVFVFARQGQPLPNFSSRFHGFTHRHGSSAVIVDQEVSVRWSDFAYVQYVTNPNYLCNSLMILEALRRHEAKADLLMLYPQEWEVPVGDASSSSYEGKLLAQARDSYNTKLKPIQVKTFTNDKDPTWQDSYTKLLAWNQTEYKRVISLDSDATVLDHMDELFLLPSAPVAMPRAYWMDHFFLSSQLIVIEPSDAEWQRVQNATENHEGSDYDMDILNKVYGTSSTVIPHRKYDLLTGTIHGENQNIYLGSPTEVWDVKKVLAEAKYVHFSDWPMPKPWIEPRPGDWEKHKPKCKTVSEAEQDCSDQVAWVEIRNEFSDRRKRICGKAYDR